MMEEIDRIELQFLIKLQAWIKELLIDHSELVARTGVSNGYFCKFFSGDGCVMCHTDLKFAEAQKVDFILGICKRQRKGKR